MKKISDDTLNTSGEQKRKRISTYLLPALLLLFLLAYTGSAIKTSRLAALALQHKGDSLLGTELVALLELSPELAQLKTDEAWAKARLLAARNEIFTLEVNLPDSLLTVSLDGTPLYQVSITAYKADPWIDRLPSSARYMLVSTPVNIKEQWSTIEKEPIVIKQAPRDTAEAAAPQVVPDTTIKKPIITRLTLENQVHLVLLPDREQKGFKWSKIQIYIRLSMDKAWNTISRIVTKGSRNYSPTLYLEIPERSCETIYRALPEQSQVVLKINQPKDGYHK